MRSARLSKPTNCEFAKTPPQKRSRFVLSGMDDAAGACAKVPVQRAPEPHTVQFGRSPFSLRGLDRQAGGHGHTRKQARQRRLRLSGVAAPRL